MGAPWFKDPPPSSSKWTLSWFQDVQRLNQPRVRPPTTFSGPQPDFACNYFRSPRSTRTPHAIIAESRKLTLSTVLKTDQYAFQETLSSVPNSSKESDQPHSFMDLRISHQPRIDKIRSSKKIESSSRFVYCGSRKFDLSVQPSVQRPDGVRAPTVNQPIGRNWDFASVSVETKGKTQITASDSETPRN